MMYTLSWKTNLEIREAILKPCLTISFQKSIELMLQFVDGRIFINKMSGERGVDRD